jgi:hypothetical protein
MVGGRGGDRAVGRGASSDPSAAAQRLAARLAALGLAAPMPAEHPCPGCYMYPGAMDWLVRRLGMRTTGAILHVETPRPFGMPTRAGVRSAAGLPGRLGMRAGDETGDRPVQVVLDRARRERCLLPTTIHYGNLAAGHDVVLVPVGGGCPLSDPPALFCYDPDGGPDDAFEQFVARLAGAAPVPTAEYPGAQTEAQVEDERLRTGWRDACPGSVAGLCSTWAILGGACAMLHGMRSGPAVDAMLAHVARSLGVRRRELAERVSYNAATTWARETRQDLDELVCCDRRTGAAAK